MLWSFWRHAHCDNTPPVPDRDSEEASISSISSDKLSSSDEAGVVAALYEWIPTQVFSTISDDDRRGRADVSEIPCIVSVDGAGLHTGRGQMQEVGIEYMGSVCWIWIPIRREKSLRSTKIIAQFVAPELSNPKLWHNCQGKSTFHPLQDAPET